jgi:tryptophanyl-tRNA synthetase
MSLPILLTGYRTSGPLHIGHYFGMMQNTENFCKQNEGYIMAADVQTLTDNFDNPQKVRDNVFEATADMLSLDLDLSQTTVFIQSQIPQIAELTVYFANLVSLNRVLRNPTVKTEIEQKKAIFGENGEGVTFGFVGYPVSQAADILFLRANIVPTGVDQAPMLEITRDIAEKFNRIYGTDLFSLPELKLTKTSKILGLDGNAKMSKSLNNAIYLKDSDEETTAKIKTAKTDSGSQITFEPENRPEISNLVLLYSLVNNITIEQAENDLKNVQYGTFKQKLAIDTNLYFKEFREKRQRIINDPKYIKEVLENGRQKVLVRAIETMDLVRKAMKIDY